MDRRARGNSFAIKGLLSRQMASITDTLAKASQRRETEVRQRQTQKPPIVHPPHTSPVPSPRFDPFMTSDTDSSGDSDSGISGIMFQGNQENTPQPPSRRVASDKVDDTKSLLDESDPRTTPYCSEENDLDDPRRMLGDMNRTTSDVRQDTLSTEADSRKLLADLQEQIPITGETTISDEHELTAMLAELRGKVLCPGSGSVKALSDDDPKRMLAELEEIRPSTWERVAIHGNDDDPKRMLANLEHMTILADREFTTVNGDEDANLHLEALRIRLANLSPISHPNEPQDSPSRTTNAPALEQHVIPYAVAIQLESARCKWVEANGWTTYLFNNILHGNEAQREKDSVVQRAKEELDAIIQDELEQERMYQIAEKSTRVPRRLVVSNIAADAGEEDLMLVFSDFRYDV
jgi:hypothetical protein